MATIAAKTQREGHTPLSYGAEGGIRTRTGFRAQRILSPLRLPVPPPRHSLFSILHHSRVCIKVLNRRVFRSLIH